MREKYALASLCRIWREKGHQVELGVDYAPDANVCILHHDLTRLEPAALPKPTSARGALNGEVLDISKRLYSQLQVLQDDTWIGPVIIKTNLNHFGVPERNSTRKQMLREVQRRIAQISWRHARMLPKRVYPVLENLGDVPQWVWDDGDLIVEKFMPECLDNGLYCVRGWLFFGNRGYCYRLFATDPMVKTGTMVGHEFLDEAPLELQALRADMKFDFGKFDYVEIDGRPILLDANKTPSFAGDPNSPRLMSLADGIEAYL